MRRQRSHRRVPVLLQEAMSQCGAACLAMVVSALVGPVSVNKVSALCDVGRDGLTAKALVEAGQSLGLRLKAVSMRELPPAGVTFPAIVFWRFNHWLVVERVTTDHVQVVDPAEGRMQLDHDTFSRGFTGIVLYPESWSSTPTSEVRTGRWRQYLRMLFTAPGVRTTITAAVFASGLLQLIALCGPLLTKVVVDRVAPQGATDLIAAIGVLIGLLAVLHFATSYLRGLITDRIRVRIDRSLMAHFLEHVLHLPLRSVQGRPSGDLLNRLTSNASIRELLGGQAVSAVFDIVMSLVSSIVIITVSPTFAAGVLVLVALQFAVFFLTGRRVMALSTEELQTQAAAESYLVECVRGIETLKATGGEAHALATWRHLFERSLASSQNRGRMMALTSAVAGAVRVFAPLALLWLGAIQAAQGTMNIGTVVALVSLGGMMMAPLSSLANTFQQVQLVVAQMKRVGDILVEPRAETADPVSAPMDGSVEVRGISFRYDKNSPWVLRDVEFSVPPGSRVAIVGRTGSGKSTLLRLLLGLYPLDEGAIRYRADGVPVPPDAVRSQVGVVLQEPVLFQGSVRENIVAHQDTADLATVQWAAQVSGLERDIAAWPMGYETMVGEEGTALSGGQRQRLALARALTRRPNLLILDEATSSVDGITEEQIHHTLRDVQCTTIMIAHRLSTVRDADLILVLSEGELVEAGRHNELVALDGEYARLVRRQIVAEPG